MRRGEFVALLGTLALPNCGGAGGTPVPAPAPTATPVRLATIPSAEIHFADGAHAPQLDLAKAAGIKTVRMDLAADWIANDGWGGYDALFAATAARGIRVLLISPYQNTGDLGAYSALVRTAAARYPTAMWEILNEPDNLGIWGAYRSTAWSASEYATFAIAVSSAIRAAAPSATILSGGTSALSPSWVAALAGAGLYENGRCDGCGLHAYGETPSTLAAKYAAVRSVLPARVGLWTTEMGSADVGSQAEYLTAMWAAHVDLGVGMMNWYELEDGAGGVPGDPSTFGLLGADGVTPKAAYYAWQQVLLAGTRTVAP